MRLRNIRGARETVESSEFVVQQPQQQKGRWQQFFGNTHPIHIEIGMGKGQFITALAKQHPNINYIGIEKYTSVLVRALPKRAELEDCSNLVFLSCDAAELGEIFAQDEIARIYLNFSDPWPKDRHAKRRLTSKEFLKRYDAFLQPAGEVMFKTDNRLLFDFSLEQAKESGWQLREVTYDLHRSEWAEGNVMTEYEEKFSAQGNPIHRMVAFREQAL